MNLRLGERSILLFSLSRINEAAWPSIGEGAMSVKRFSQALANRGLHRGKHHTTRRAVFEGVRLIPRAAP